MLDRVEGSFVRCTTIVHYILITSRVDVNAVSDDIHTIRSDLITYTSE